MLFQALPPAGFRAGRVTQVNSVPLSPGPHTLILSPGDPSSSSARRVAVIFYKEGFTVEENGREDGGGSGLRRRRRVATMEDVAETVPPLRPYGERDNENFLKSLRKNFGGSA